MIISGYAVRMGRTRIVEGPDACRAPHGRPGVRHLHVPIVSQHVCGPCCSARSATVRRSQSQASCSQRLCRTRHSVFRDTNGRDVEITPHWDRCMNTTVKTLCAQIHAKFWNIGGDHTHGTGSGRVKHCVYNFKTRNTFRHESGVDLSPYHAWPDSCPHSAHCNL